MGYFLSISPLFDYFALISNYVGDEASGVFQVYPQRIGEKEVHEKFIRQVWSRQLLLCFKTLLDSASGNFLLPGLGTTKRDLSLMSNIMKSKKRAL